MALVTEAAAAKFSQRGNATFLPFMKPSSGSDDFC